MKRAVPAGYLEPQIDRVMLEQRRYQKRVFRGRPCVCAVLQESGNRSGMLVYLPGDVTDALPLYQLFTARLIAEAHLSVDQYESHPFALAALALAREVPSQPRRG